MAPLPRREPSHRVSKGGASRLARFIRECRGACLLGLLYFGCGGSVGGTQQGAFGGSGNSGVGGNGDSGVGGTVMGGQGNAGSISTTIDCSRVLCGFSDCVAGYARVAIAGQCCPVCLTIDPSCAQVSCLGLICPSGFVVQREPGACCDTCAPTPSATYPNCSVVDCAPPSTCPTGYHYTQPAWACCGVCQADPNFCEQDSDCLMATKDTGCCSCPTSISTRLYAQDPCYSGVNSPRPVPESCIPQVACDMMCGACPEWGTAVCSAHTCSVAYLTGPN